MDSRVFELLRRIPHKILNIFVCYKLNMDENWQRYDQNVPNFITG
jgi:hypothetical protein